MWFSLYSFVPLLIVPALWCLWKVPCEIELSTSAARLSHSHATFLLINTRSSSWRRHFIISALWYNSISVNCVFGLFISINFIIFSLFVSIIVMLLYITLDFSSTSTFFMVIFTIRMLYLDFMAYYLCRITCINVISFIKCYSYASATV